MAPYQSRLESVVKTRRYHQEEVRMALMVQEDLLSQEKAILREMIASSETARNHLKSRQKVITSSEIQLYHEFIHYQQKRIDGQNKKVAICADACESKRIVLEKATTNKKIVENVVAKQRQVYLSALNKKELLLLDEVAGQMKWRRR